MSILNGGVSTLVDDIVHVHLQKKATELKNEQDFKYLYAMASQNT